MSRLKYTKAGPPPARESRFGFYTVRLFDMFDGWIDIKVGLTWPEAVDLWLERTSNGTCKVCYGDGDYYDIFPNETRMLMTPETLGR